MSSAPVIFSAVPTLFGPGGELDLDANRALHKFVAGLVDGVEYVEIDAESRLDLVRRLNVLSTPTVLVLGPDGAITKQATGLPRKPDVLAALGDVIPFGAGE